MLISFQIRLYQSNVTDNIQENSDQKILSGIASDFGYSGNVPSLISYPGLVV